MLFYNAKISDKNTDSNHSSKSLNDNNKINHKGRKANGLDKGIFTELLSPLISSKNTFNVSDLITENVKTHETNSKKESDFKETHSEYSIDTLYSQTTNQHDESFKDFAHSLLSVSNIQLDMMSQKRCGNEINCDCSATVTHDKNIYSYNNPHEMEKTIQELLNDIHNKVFKNMTGYAFIAQLLNPGNTTLTMIERIIYAQLSHKKPYNQKDAQTLFIQWYKNLNKDSIKKTPMISLLFTSKNKDATVSNLDRILKSESSIEQLSQMLDLQHAYKSLPMNIPKESINALVGEINKQLSEPIGNFTLRGCKVYTVDSDPLLASISASVYTLDNLSNFVDYNPYNHIIMKNTVNWLNKHINKGININVSKTKGDNLTLFSVQIINTEKLISLGVQYAQIELIRPFIIKLLREIDNIVFSNIKTCNKSYQYTLEKDIKATMKSHIRYAIAHHLLKTFLG